MSLLFALGGPEVSNHVRNSADAAVKAALQVFEDAACRVRRGNGGLTVLDGDGSVAAGFRHRTSWAGDPHLRTHVVIANLAHTATDHRWTALDARPLYAWSAPAGYLYEAHLRWELTQRLGVDWGPVRNGAVRRLGAGGSRLARPWTMSFEATMFKADGCDEWDGAQVVGWSSDLTDVRAFHSVVRRCHIRELLRVW